ncbi:MAG: hypothetical protein ABII63_05175 [Pseudomonadota bacterium]
MSQLPLFEQEKQRGAKPASLQKRIDLLEELSLVRLSPNFIMRDLMYSTEVSAMGLSNYPEHPEMVIRAGKLLCEKVLEPVLEKFGRFAITFGYQCRAGVERHMSEKQRLERPRSSSPHQWDRGTFGDEVYARVDILVFAVEDGFVSKMEFGHWLMNNLDIDLLMMWKRANICCISISPKPRRVWFEWGDPALGQPRRETFMGTHYWQNIYPLLLDSARPNFAPSCSGGNVQWR